MHRLTSPELLDMWDATNGQPPDMAAVAMLVAVMPELGEAGVSALPIGRRDAALLDLREQTFGRRLLATSTCTACGEPAELAFEVDDVRASAEPSVDLKAEGDGLAVSFRLPTTADVLAAHDAHDVGAIRKVLIEACVTHLDGTPLAPGELDSADELIERIEAGMAAADPQADVRLALDCPACGHPARVPFDIVTFLVDEIDTWARRTLREVAQLASSFGWREADVLALAPQRRQYYLETLAS